jgi:transposase InsO family protein
LTLSALGAAAVGGFNASRDLGSEWNESTLRDLALPAEYIEPFYNRERRHSTLGMLSSVKFREEPCRSTPQDIR